MSENKWYDAIDHSPQLVCEVELSNGNCTDAVWVMGEWNTLEGEVIYPVRFRIKTACIITPLYDYGLKA